MLEFNEIKKMFSENIKFEFSKFDTISGKSYLYIKILFRGGEVNLDLLNRFENPHQTRYVDKTLLRYVAKPLLKKQRGQLLKLEMSDNFLTTRIVKALALEKYRETNEYKMKILYGNEFEKKIEELERKNKYEYF